MTIKTTDMQDFNIVDETKVKKRRMFDSMKVRVAKDIHGKLVSYSLANSLPFYSRVYRKIID